MGGRVLHGSFAALERAFLDRLRGLGPGPDRPVLIVAPSRALADTLQRLAAASIGPGSALLGARFLTFHALALRLAEPERPVFGDGLFYDKLVDWLIERGEGKDWDRGYRGLSSSVRSSVKDLRDAGVEPEAVLAAAREGLFGPDEELGAFPKLLRLQRDFQTALAGLGLFSPADLTRSATLRAPESPFLKACAGILYYGFYDLTGLQADFFHAVARNHPVTVFFPHIKGHPAYAFAGAFSDAQLQGYPNQSLAEPEGVSALGPALGSLFVPGAEPRRAPGLALASASGSRDELWRAAKEILRWVEEEGWGFSEIGVAARSLEPYRPYLLEIFRRHGIPFTTTAEEPLLRHPLAKLSLALLAWARRDYPALTVLDLLGSPHLTASSGSAWPLLIRRLQIHGGWAQWEGRLERWRSGGFPLAPLDPEGEIVPKEEVAGLLDFVRKLKADLEPGGLGWAGCVRRALKILRDRLDVGADPVGGVVEDAIGSLAAYDQAYPEAPWPLFLETLEEKLRRATLPLTPRDKLGVRVLDAMAARGESFRGLVLLGLKEGAFPRLIREDPFLRDGVRARLRDRAGHWIQPKLAGYDEERLLFHLLVSSARERLLAVYPRSDEDGKAQVPSIYLLELCRASGLSLGDAENVPLRLLAKVESRPLERLTPEEAVLRLELHGRDPSPVLEALGLAADRWRALSGAARDLSRRGSPGERDGLLGRSLEPELARGLTASQLESLATCPWQFFASSILGLREPEAASSLGEFASGVKGQIYHAFLAAFYRRLASAPGERGQEVPEAEFNAAAEEAFRGLNARTLGLYPVLWRAEREKMQAHLRAFLEWELAELRSTGFRPEAAEESLQGELELGGRKLALRGRLDRLDVGPSGYRVVDYKTSAWESGRPATALLRLRALQLPLYLELAKTRAAGAPAGGALHRIEDRPRDFGFDGAEWERLRPGIFSRLQQTVELAARGEFFLYPSPAGPAGWCQRCAFGAICRRAHPPSLSRARNSPGFKAYDAMKRGQDD